MWQQNRELDPPMVGRLTIFLIDFIVNSVGIDIKIWRYLDARTLLSHTAKDIFHVEGADSVSLCTDTSKSHSCQHFVETRWLVQLLALVLVMVVMVMIKMFMIAIPITTTTIIAL